MKKEHPRRDCVTAGAAGKGEHSKFTAPSPAFQPPSANNANGDQTAADATRLNSALDFALRYARLGFHVFPLHSMLDGRCTCAGECGRNAAKHPRVRGGFKAATTDARQIETWWRKWPDANVAIATGSISGIVVIDIDGTQGLSTLQEIVNKHGPLPRTAMVRTARGWHLYFRMPPGIAISCSAGDGLDVRGDGGYAVAPPSVHAAGHVYQWGSDAVA